MIPARESMMLPVVDEYIGRQYSILAREVPFFAHRIDLYGYSPATDSLLAVELKLRNWRRAFQQALVYQLCSDYVYIALPDTVVGRVERNWLQEYGVGLLSISEDVCLEELPAAPSSVLNSAYKASYRAYFERIVACQE